MKKQEQKQVGQKIAPYLYVRDHGVKTWQEFHRFNQKFPDASDALVFALIARLSKEQGVKLLGL